MSIAISSSRDKIFLSLSDPVYDIVIWNKNDKIIVYFTDSKTLETLKNNELFSKMKKVSDQFINQECCVGSYAFTGKIKELKSLLKISLDSKIKIIPRYTFKKRYSQLLLNS